MQVPSPEHSPTDTVFFYGENPIIRVEERQTQTAEHGRKIFYLVSFLPVAPTQPLVEEAIEIMKIFKDITWDFELLCDMRECKFGEQLAFVNSYRNLIGLIENPNCRHCWVFTEPLPRLVGPLIMYSIQAIVSALGVQCSFIQNQRLH